MTILGHAADALHAALAAVAPGTPLRDGLDRVVRAKMGALVVLGDGPDVLAICLAIVSAMSNHPLPPDLVVFGEVGLAGEVRQVPHASRRLSEAARLGFARAIVPANSPNGVAGIELVRVATVAEALSAAGLGGP